MTTSRDPEFLIEIYRRMFRIRVFEEVSKELLLNGTLYGSLHTSIGQEAEIVGACIALRHDDYMVGNHRSHGHPIGKNADLNALMAELMGRETGINAGKGGSMHLSDFGVGSLGETSIVGSGLPVAAGAGLGSQLQGRDSVTLCFFGDGAANEGTFHESLNLAALWRLPVIYLCENNGYGELTAFSDSVTVEHIATRAVSYGIPGIVVDGQDPLAVFDVVDTAVARARAGEGPSLIEAKTYRFDNHAVGLPIEHYRDGEEVRDWRENRDPVAMFRAVVAEVAEEPTLQELEEQVRAQVDAAVEFAKRSPEPPPEAAFDHLFTNPITIHR